MLYGVLYDLIALGMWVYTRAVFRVCTIGGKGLRSRPGVMIVCTHRAETDVALVCPSIYFSQALWRRRRWRPRFAAREDLFERGFIAGFPERLRPRVRRALYGVGAGHPLSQMGVHRVSYPSVRAIRLGRALASLPGDLPLEPLLPPAAMKRFSERAEEIRRRRPRTVRDARRGVYADLLWESFTSDELSHPAFAQAWQQRALEGAVNLRSLVDVIRSGEVLFLFPEGRPSPDGEIGPVQKTMGMLVRRGRPPLVQPVGIAYDPLTTGRTRAFVAFGASFTPPEEQVDTAVLAVLRRVTPLTCGQVVAHKLTEAARGGREIVERRELEASLASAVELALDEGRPADPALLEEGRRRRRLSRCLDWLAREGVAEISAENVRLPDPEAVLSDERLRRLAVEYASARALVDARTSPA